MKEAKHYGASYLTDTGEFLKQLKIQSYKPFSDIREGVIVDLGCGTGMDAVNLADMLAENVHVVGVDHDPLLIEQARNAAGERKNIDFVQGEVYQLSFEENTISGIRMERVIQHLSRPQTMFQEVYRVLRVDCPLVIVETIWNSLNFYTGHIETEQKIRNYLTNQKVNNGWAGNKLTKDLIVNGFREVHLETFCMVVTSKEEADRYLFLDKILLEMTEKRALTEVEASEFSQSLSEASEGGYFVSSMNLILTKAIK